MFRRVAAACMVLVACSGQQGASTNNPLDLKMDEAGAVGACLTPEEQRLDPAQMTLEKRRAAIGCIQAQAVQQLRPQLPKQVDPLTQITDISAQGATLTYHQTVDVAADTLPPGTVQQLETQVRATVCAERSMRGTIDLGGAYAYRWKDKAGRAIHAMRIDRCPTG